VHWVLFVAPSTNFHVIVVSPRPKVDGRTAVPVMSLSQLSFAFGAVIVNAMRQELSVILAVIGLIVLQSITGTDLSDTVIF
jgi:hypothetical protein